ncbi:MAG TPA: prepilin-type N-terminal cleavage/methylation domain-containing protein [Cellvibrionaceae bacterium]
MRKTQKHQGFTLLEMMVAITVAGLLMAVSVPAANKMYQSMAYRSAVGEVKSLLENGRYRAQVYGQPMDILVRPETRELALGDKVHTLPALISLDVVSAAELMRDNKTAVIRFYPDGSSSGGRITLLRGEGSGVALEVGWLLGEVIQHPLTDR